MFAVWSPLPPWGQRLFRVALEIHNFLRFQSLQKKGQGYHEYIVKFQMYKVQMSLHKVVGPYVPSILCVELWNSEKKSVNFLTRDLVFCPHTIKNMRPKTF